MEQEQTHTRERTRTDLREPRKFHVIIYNDDFTTMDFVVMILTTIFRKTEEEAESLMLCVHNNGSAIVGTYSYDIAYTKMEKATSMARAEHFPLRLSIEPVSEC